MKNILILAIEKSILVRRQCGRVVAAVSVMTALLVHSFSPLLVDATTGTPVKPVYAMRFVLPLAQERGPSRSLRVVATAYNSLVGQTDSTPFITASGTRTRHGVIAANFLPIGTRVRFPEVYGNTIFTVEDRMNARYRYGRVDIWMESYPQAKQFGAQHLLMEVF